MKIETIKEYVLQISPKTELLTEVYINNRQQLRFRCSCGREFQKTWDTIQTMKSCLCRSCARKKGWEENRRDGGYKEKWIQEFEEYGLIVKGDFFSKREKVLCENQDGYLGYISLQNVCLGKMFSVFSLKFNEENLLYNLNNYAHLHHIGTKVISYIKKSRSCDTLIKCRCECGDYFETNIGNFTTQNKWRCNRCNKSMSNLEYKVKLFLEENQIKYIGQKRFDECRNPLTRYPLPFDFYLPEYNVCIEVDGCQHFHEKYLIGKHGVAEEDKEKEFKYLKFKDNIKDSFCKDNGIELVRISYKDIEKQSTKYKDILNNLFNRL